MLASLRALVLICFVVAVAACQPPAAPSKEKPDDKKTPKVEEAPSKPSQETPTKTAPAQELTGIPALTGDKTKDKVAIEKALVDVKSEWEANQKELMKVTKDGTEKNPDATKVKTLKAKNDEFKARAEKLQELLDKTKGS